MSRLPNVWASPFLRAAEARKARGRVIADLKKKAEEQAKTKDSARG